MAADDVLAEAAAVVRQTADARLRRALHDRGQAVDAVRDRMREVNGAPQDPDLARAIDWADAAWSEVRAWWAFVCGSPEQEAG